MKSQRNALNVLERTSHYLKAGLLTEQPAWFKVVGSYPPQKDLTKKVHPQRLKDAQRKGIPSNSKATSQTRLKAKHLSNRLYKNQKIRFLEDSLRKLFYEQHPWELADPKLLIENENLLKAGMLDWSTIRQVYKPVDGESVVQRTMYLLQNQDQNKKELSVVEAYDMARFEYYRVKMELDMERQISLEESEMYGAVYHTSPVGFGFAKEQEVIDNWVQKADELTQVDLALRNEQKVDSDMSAGDADAAEFDLSETMSFEQLSNDQDKGL